MLCLRCGVGKTLLEDLSGGVPMIHYCKPVFHLLMFLEIL